MTLLFFACNTWPLNSVICVSLTNTSIINTWITSAIKFYVSDPKIDRDFHVYLFDRKSQASIGCLTCAGLNSITKLATDA